MNQLLVSTPTIDISAAAVEPASENVASWRELAACRGLDPSLFFPDEGDHVAVENAQQVCATCPVAQECLSYALWANQTDGIWGGNTPGERRRYRRMLVKELREVS